MRKIRLHWRLHPHKNEDWYREQCTRMTQDEVARELDISYTLSVSGKVFTPFKPEIHVSEERIAPNPHLPVYRIWDFGMVNAVLYAQVDEFGRVRLLHERVLGLQVPSNTQEQMAVAQQDSSRWFAPGSEFVDICDPAGSYDDHRGARPDVEVLEDIGAYAEYDAIIDLPTRDRKVRGRQYVLQALQSLPGGEPGFKLYCAEDNAQGCPILKQAFLSEYRYKKDPFGNYTDIILERHPYEDVMDCLIYLFLHIQRHHLSRQQSARYGNVKIHYNPHGQNEFTGY